MSAPFSLCADLAAQEDSVLTLMVLADVRRSIIRYGACSLFGVIGLAGIRQRG